jgi:hypothetical protein
MRASAFVNMQRSLRLASLAVLSLALCFGTRDAAAARIGVLSNNHADAVVADFTPHVAGHTFTAVDVSTGPPPLATLLASFDEILLFEDGLFQSAPDVGNVVYAFAESGRPVVLATFYDQDRSDRAGLVLGPPHGWGQLETIDPNTTDTLGAATTARTLDPASIVVHPLTVNVHSLFGNKGFAAGNQAKPGTVVVATWLQPNANGQPDPAIAYRLTNVTCVMHVAIAPDYSVYGTFGIDFGGDYYQVWKNAFDYGSGNCGRGWHVPALAPGALALLAALVAGLAVAKRRRRATRPIASR